jgi:hypothetical protein
MLWRYVALWCRLFPVPHFVNKGSCEPSVLGMIISFMIMTPGEIGVVDSSVLNIVPPWDPGTIDLKLIR